MTVSDAARARGVRERRRCPHCTKRVIRLGGGKLRSHVDKNGEHCPGSGLITR